MTQQAQNIQGSIVALVTPMFEDGRVDWKSLEKLVEWHIQQGTHSIVAVGTTGEASTLSMEEHTQVIKEVIRVANKRIPIIAGTGANSTHEAIELTKAAKELGADAALLVTPIIINQLKKAYINTTKRLLKLLIFHKFFIMFQVVLVLICKTKP